MIDFQPADIGYLQRAFSDAIEEARRRSERNMTSSAATYEYPAKNSKKLRDKILSTMPEKIRASYPDYKEPDDSDARGQAEAGSAEHRRTVCEIALDHARMAQDYEHDPRGAAIEFRKHLGWYVKGLHNSAELQIAA